MGGLAPAPQGGSGLDDTAVLELRRNLRRHTGRGAGSLELNRSNVTLAIEAGLTELVDGRAHRVVPGINGRAIRHECDMAVPWRAVIGKGAPAGITRTITGKQGERTIRAIADQIVSERCKRPRCGKTTGTVRATSTSAHHVEGEQGVLQLQALESASGMNPTPKPDYSGGNKPGIIIDAPANTRRHIATEHTVGDRHGAPVIQ
jgi:hypothetical protein